MKEKIKEVQNYFVDKIVRGLYKVDEITEHTIVVVVDKKYRFKLWTANGVHHFEVYNSGGSFMNLDFTEKEKEAAYKIASKHRQGWIDGEKREKELKELDRLRAKYLEVL